MHLGNLAEKQKDDVIWMSYLCKKSAKSGFGGEGEIERDGFAAGDGDFFTL